MNEKNIDLDKFSNNPFIKLHIKLLKFLKYAKENNKKVIILNRKDKL